MSKKVIGILGGMGPEATIDLFERITRVTPAKRDQDHLRVIIYSNPSIPDRTKSILKKGPSPVPLAAKGLQILEKAGADFIIIPCNTIHYYLGELQRRTRIPILNMISLTSQYIKRKYPRVKTVGLIATTGTVRSRLYDRAMKESGLRLVVPSKRIQRKIMKTIYQIKAGNISEMARQHFVLAARDLHARGAEVVVSGCTELSLLTRGGKLPVTVVDPVQILAVTSVSRALGRGKFNPR